MLTISPVNITAGVVSIVVTPLELLPLDSLVSSTPFDGSWQSCPTPGAAVHCGTAMELVTPAVGPAAVGYSFEPEGGGPVQLPPVWRCGCGFQLDAWIRSPFARAPHEESVAPHAPHFPALSA